VIQCRVARLRWGPSVGTGTHAWILSHPGTFTLSSSSLSHRARNTFDMTIAILLHLEGQLRHTISSFGPDDWESNVRCPVFILLATYLLRAGRYFDEDTWFNVQTSWYYICSICFVPWCSSYSICSFPTCYSCPTCFWHFSCAICSTTESTGDAIYKLTG
jgi:hypothetical protein